MVLAVGIAAFLPVHVHAAEGDRFIDAVTALVADLNGVVGDEGAASAERRG